PVISGADDSCGGLAAAPDRQWVIMGSFHCWLRLLGMAVVLAGAKGMADTPRAREESGRLPSQPANASPGPTGEKSPLAPGLLSRPIRVQNGASQVVREPRLPRSLADGRDPRRQSSSAGAWGGRLCSSGGFTGRPPGDLGSPAPPGLPQGLQGSRPDVRAQSA